MNEARLRSQLRLDIRCIPVRSCEHLQELSEQVDDQAWLASMFVADGRSAQVVMQLTTLLRPLRAALMLAMPAGPLQDFNRCQDKAGKLDVHVRRRKRRWIITQVDPHPQRADLVLGRLAN